MSLRRKKRTRRTSYARPTTLKRRSVSKKRTLGRTKKANTNRNPLSTRKKRQRSRGISGLWYRVRRPLLLIIIGVITLAIVNTLFLTNKLNIKTIDIYEDGIFNSNNEIQTLLSSLIDSNIILLKTNELEPYLKEQFPQYESLKIEKNLPDTIIVTVENYPIVAELTIETLDGAEQKFYLSSSGKTIEYDENALLQEYLQITTETDQSVSIGSDIMTQEKLGFILEAIQSYEDRFGMKVLHAKYFQIEHETHLWTERNFYVWLDMTIDLDSQLNKLKKALPKLDIYESDLEYIDLRIEGINGEKVIYK